LPASGGVFIPFKIVKTRELSGPLLNRIRNYFGIIISRRTPEIGGIINIAFLLFMADLENTILLKTKLHRPRLPKDLVERNRLIEKLNNELDRQLTLVCAPAGFGKTTLVSNWLRHLEENQPPALVSLPAAWFTLDKRDSDLNLFLRYFIAALRTVFPGACPETLTLLVPRQTPPQEALFSTFLNELSELPGEVILVLDDYNTIQSGELDNLLNEMASHWPRPLHLVLVSRVNPAIPLANLRAKGKLNEIRTQDLRFTPKEVALYLSQSLTIPPSQDALLLLDEQFEGWPAGLHIATLTLRSTGYQESALTAFSGEDTNITEYLVNEVLNQQYPAIYQFLLKTSLLDRFCVELCEDVLGESGGAWDARACLDWIERSELFLIPLDEHREWYRYHHLFQEMLQRRLSIEMVAEEIKGLHLRVSAWFEEKGLVDEALEHALTVGDLDLAARLMKEGLHRVIDLVDRPTLDRWLRLLPEELIQRDPGLLMIRVWSLQWSWQLDQQAKVIQQIEKLLESEPGASLTEEGFRIISGQITLVKAQYAYFNNQSGQTIELCQQVLEIFPPAWSYLRGSAMLYLALAKQAIGQVDAAEKLLLDEYRLCINKSDLYPLILLQTLGMIYIWTCQHSRAIQTGQLLVQDATKSGIGFTKLWGDYITGMACYQNNDLAAAEESFLTILNNRYTANGSVYRDAIAGLALTHQARGESAEALGKVGLVSKLDLEQSGSEDERTRSLRARLMLLQGDLAGARRWADSYTTPPPDIPLIWLEEPQATRVRILIAAGGESDLQEAQKILDILGGVTERNYNFRYKIEVMALRALVLDARGLTSQAEAELKQALGLARPECCIRVFIDLGEPIQKMLLRLEKQDYSPETIQPILAAFQMEVVKSPPQPKTHPPPYPLRPNGPLTRRELQVLSLLRGPLSIKEIAIELNISPATAKRHTINIYRKLGVNRRWEAVAKAEELEILPSR